MVVKALGEHRQKVQLLLLDESLGLVRAFGGLNIQPCLASQGGHRVRQIYGLDGGYEVLIHGELVGQGGAHKGVHGEDENAGQQDGA